jgi:hypothetical protein
MMTAIEQTYTTTMPPPPPEPKYRRLDMAKLPPYRMEKLTHDELKAAIPFWDTFCPIRFKNVWDDEKEAKRAADEQKAYLARTETRKTQTKSRKMRRPFCKFCMHRGLPLDECKTHYTKSGPEFGATITCPELLKEQCARCGEHGHTPTYCKSQYWLKTDPREIVEPPKLVKDRFFKHMLEEKNIKDWQYPIPPALQSAFDEYQEKYVKPSRIWIEMTGDHKHYTNDFRLVMLIKNEDDWFDCRERTEYENRVQAHWEMMRTVIWDDETPIRSSRDKIHIIRDAPPPTYEEATAASELLQAVDPTTPHANEVKLTSVLKRLPEETRTKFERDCARTMRNIIVKYIEHQSK